MKDIFVLEDVQEPESPPEYVLWLAVIDRAIADYCCPAKELTKKYSADLKSFFFDDKPRPNNLVYICNFLLDREDAVKKIRDKVISLKQETEYTYACMRYFNTRR
jgi:hypothetical protein